jgi:hypothetical protein
MWTKEWPKKTGYYWIYAKYLGVATIACVDSRFYQLRTFSNPNQWVTESYIRFSCPDLKFGPEIKAPSIAKLKRRQPGFNPRLSH